MIEVSVRVSNEESSLVQKFLVYDTITLSADDPKLQEMVKSTTTNFNRAAEDVVVRIKMVLR